MDPALVFFDSESANANPRASQLLELLRSRTPEIYSVSPAVFRSMSQTDNPQGILAIYPFPGLPIPSEPGLSIVLDAIRDPGNLGTILRTAWAAGVDVAILGPGTADAFNPKAVRSAMGAHFYMPIVTQSWDEIAISLAKIPRVYLAEASGHISYTSADWTRPFALIVGGEAIGAGPEAHRLATTHLTIAMPGGAESLNAAVATGILLFEAVKS